MSQTPLAGHGQCPSCKQQRPYTNQICYICSARLPWAAPTVPQAPTPPPLPRYPQQSPPQNSGTKSNTVAIVVAALCGVFIVIPLVTIVGLSILGNRIKSTFRDTNAISTQATSASQVSSKTAACGAMNPAECEWGRQLDIAVIPMGEKGPPLETVYMQLLRHQAELQQVKKSTPSLITTPPRCLYASTKFTAAIDEMTQGLQSEQSAYDHNSWRDLRDANGHYGNAIDLADQAVRAMDDLRETAGPPA